MSSNAPNTSPTPKLEKFTPVLNKLFMNRLRGLIQEEYSFKNLDRTKKDLLAKHGVPFDSKIYNYKQAETRKISHNYAALLPENTKKEMNAISRSMQHKLSFILFAGFAFYGGGYYAKRFSTWGRLTSSGLFQKAVVYCLLLNTTNYFMLVRNSEEMKLIFKHHCHYEQAITAYEEDLASASTILT